jgi:hypothetical protein
MGELIDGMSDVMDAIDKLEAKIKKLNGDYNELESDLMASFEKARVNKAAGKKASASLGSSRHPNITDMEAFNNYIMKHRAFDLYQRRINSKAYFDRLENKDAVPGVKVFEKFKVKVTRKRS